MLNLPLNPQFCQTDVSGSTLVNADCFDVFPFIEDKSIDAIICDLPYGTTRNKWDSVLPLDKLWSEYKRILKARGVVILFAQIPFSITLGASNLKWLKYEWIWEKTRPTGFLNAKKMPLKSHENILVFYEKIGIYNPIMSEGHEPLKGTFSKSKSSNYGQYECFVSDRSKGGQTDRYPRTNVKYNSVFNKNLSPTQKPLELLEYLIKTYTNEGDIVLDNTMGSGTTNLACIKLNRKSIGIEKEKQYYDVAVRRALEYCH